MKTVFAIAFALAAPAAIAAPIPATAEAAVRLSLDTPIEAIVADPAGKAVLDANLPGIESHPSYDMFKGMSLRQLAPYSQGKLTDEILAKVEKELAAIK